MDCDHQGPLSMEFPRQEYCSGLPFPSPGDLPTPGMEPRSPVSPALAGEFFTTAPPGEQGFYLWLGIEIPCVSWYGQKNKENSLKNKKMMV